MAISANEILDGLDDAQRRAACSVDGPVRIIACAGAGKTRTITRRIAYACASGAWEASRALAVTFSVKAAQEMRTRLLDLGVGEDMHIATFHAAALHQLRTMWPDVCEGPFPVLSESPRDLVGAALFRALNMQPERNVVQDVHAEIDWCKVSLIAPEDYVRVCEATHHAPPAPLDPQSFTRVYDQYEQEKAARMEIDFNDILLVTAHILDTYPEVGEQVRAHLGWLTVDEYQDVSPLQHRLMRSWLGAHRNVCVVGDPAQTIYSFAGATSYYLNHFAREFHPLAADIALDTDYRSAQSIVARANTVLGKSAQREDYLKLKAVREGSRRVLSAAYETDAQEAQAVAARIARLVVQGARPGDFAVLARLSGQQRVVVQALQEQGLPYQVRRNSGWQQSALQPAAAVEGAPVGDVEALDQGRVTVSTIHASKGLEFDHVFLVGLSEGLMPYRVSDDVEALEEERRVLYVGVTRAQESLYLSYAKRQDERAGRVRQPTRFL